MHPALADLSSTALTLLSAMGARAESLVPLLALALLVGEPLALVTGIRHLLRLTRRAAHFFARKLDREKRSIATRIYRGIVATVLLLIPAIALGVLLTLPIPALSIIANLAIIALLGQAFSSVRLVSFWRKARVGGLALELPQRDFLFADSHAVIRYSILTSGEQLATGVIGASFWYIIGGLPLMLPYLLLSILADSYRRSIFGWSATALFRAVDAIPRLIALLLFTLAAFFTPRTHPLAVRKARNFHGFLAYLLGISIGGTLPGRELSWAGGGTPKPTATELGRFLLLRFVASLLLILLIAVPSLLLSQ